MIKTFDENPKIMRPHTTESGTVDRFYNLTQFVADELADIAVMNAEGSEYLNYPAGSAAICMEDGNVYVLNAAETEYAVPGGDGT